MAKRKYTKTDYSYGEAKATETNLTSDDRPLFERIRAARKRVLANPLAEYKRVTVAAEACLRTEHAVRFLPIIEALERGPTEETPPRDAGASAPLPEPLAEAIKDLQARLHGFGNTFAVLMRDAISKEREHTQSAFEPRTIAAERALRDMTFQKNDFEEAAAEVAVEYEELQREHDGAKQSIAKLEDDVTVFQIRLVQAEKETADAVSEAKELRQTIVAEREVHQQEIERLRGEHERARSFDQDMIATLVQSANRKNRGY